MEKDEAPRRSPNVTWDAWNIPRAEREAAQGHPAAVLWLTGLSGAGKSTIARAVERRLASEGYRTMLLDGDQLRHGLNGDLGFSPADRAENVRRAGEVAKLFFEAGHVVLCTFVSPYQRDRDVVRGLLPEGRFAEIHVTAPIELLRERDVKGLYAKQAADGSVGLTGVTAPYEVPEHAELVVDTSAISEEQAVLAVLSQVRQMAPRKAGG